MLKLSRQVDYGAPPPPFVLTDTDGQNRNLDEFTGGKALLVAFICNHCPFVQHLLDGLVDYAREFIPQGLQIVAISSNDPADFADDGPEEMARLAREKAFPFPYLFDVTQDVALAYGAICTPDFFLYDGAMKLAYCGQFEASRPRLGHPPMTGTEAYRWSLPVDGADMRRATEALLAGESAPMPQHPSAGCSIKWRPGKDPNWD